MTKYILSHGEEDTDMPLAWEHIPEEAIELIGRDYIIKSLYFSPKDGVERQSTVFLREVESFKRGMKKFNITEDTVLGI